MTGELKVEYVVGGTTVKHYMTQLQLSELLKDTDIILLSVNAPKVKRYRRKKRLISGIHRKVILSVRMNRH